MVKVDADPGEVGLDGARLRRAVFGNQDDHSFEFFRVERLVNGMCVGDYETPIGEMGHSLTLSERMKLEIPLSESTRTGFWLAAGGSTLAGHSALEDGFAANLSGGFHHAYPGHGEGFCMIHDVGVAIRSLQAAGKIRTAMTVDTDVHHGNGTAAIFGDDDSVFTLSIHQENNYPMPKPPSDEDIGLADGTRDHEYLDALEEGLLHALKKMTPDLIFYVGGADPYREDQLGGLALTLEGLQKRDRLVFEHARRRGIPVASTLAGGYARRVEDTVRIHVNTIIAARDVMVQQSPPANS
jgi:acetoin utilization deacetylase AcuC-like enzyme